MVEVCIRKGKQQDFPSLAMIMSTTEAWSAFGIDYNSAISILEGMEDIFYVAEDNNKILGFITIRLNGVGNIGAYIRMIAVDESYRGMGIGTRMIDFIGSLVREEIHNLFLICSTDNYDAQRFYENVGFKKVGIMKDLVMRGHDEFWFRKCFGPIL